MKIIILLLLPIGLLLSCNQTDKGYIIGIEPDYNIYSGKIIDTYDHPGYTEYHTDTDNKGRKSSHTHYHKAIYKFDIQKIDDLTSNLIHNWIYVNSNDYYHFKRGDIYESNNQERLYYMIYIQLQQKDKNGKLQILKGQKGYPYDRAKNMYIEQWIDFEDGK